MKGTKLWYILTLLAFALLPLAGCGSGSSSTPTLVTENGVKVSVDGQVNGAGAAKAAAGDLGTVYVYNAQDGTELGSTAVAANGSFSGLSFTLPATKAVLVFKAIVTQGTFRSIVPIDLSNPPTAGTVTGSNPISIVISQESNNTATVVSTLLGLAGVLGDTGMTLDAVSSSYVAAAQRVVDNGGQQLAYSGAGLALTGKFASAAMLPALEASNFSADQLNNMLLNGAITAAYIPGNKPVVSFYVTNSATGKGIRGIKSFSVAIAQLKPGSNGSPDQWLSYMTTGSTVRPGIEATTNVAGALIDNGDGSYTYAFAKDIKTGTGGTVPYDANLTHRLIVQVRATPSVAMLNNGTNLSNFFNEKFLVYDFIPATPATTPTDVRAIVTTDACNECHTKIGVTTPHGGRGDVRYCAICHTQQRANGRTNSTSTAGAFPAITYGTTGSITSASTYIADGEVSGDFVVMIHKIHMGDELTKDNYNYAGVLFDQIVYPKSILNCRQCHKGDNAIQLAAAPQANNWKERPSRKSCGSCHDNVDFATGVGHEAAGSANAVQPNDQFCGSCHGVSGPAPVEKFHLTVDPTTNNPSVATGLVNFTYDINSVTVDASNQAVVKFRILKDGTPIVLDGIATNPLAGFTGGPSFLLAYAQAGSIDFTNMGHAGNKAAQPISFSVGNLLRGDASVATYTGPDGAGYYTATLIANRSGTAAPYTYTSAAFPVGATMRTVALQGYFTQISPAAARHALPAIKSVTGDTVRRVVVDGEKCGNCHEWFEGHGGNRIIGKGIGYDEVRNSSNVLTSYAPKQNVCVLCHVPGLSSSGRGAAIVGYSGTNVATLATIAALGSDPTVYPEATNNFKDMIHSIHAGSNSLVVGSPIKFVRDRGTSGVFYYDFGFVKFPGIVKNCRMCHGDTFNNLPVTTAGAFVSVPDGAAVTTNVTTNGTPIDTTNNVAVIDASRRSLPNATDLVTTPFAATCVSCHSKANAIAHITQNGGQIKVARSSVANPSTEACVTCHGTSGPAALFNVHRFSVVGE